MTTPSFKFNEKNRFFHSLSSQYIATNNVTSLHKNDERYRVNYNVDHFDPRTLRGIAIKNHTDYKSRHCTFSLFFR